MKFVLAFLLPLTQIIAQTAVSPVQTFELAIPLASALPTVCVFPGDVVYKTGSNAGLYVSTVCALGVPTYVLATAAFTGDVTSSLGSSVLTLTTTGVTAASYGDANHIPQIAIDAKGRITAATNVFITGGGGGGSATPAFNVSRNSDNVTINVTTGTGMTECGNYPFTYAGAPNIVLGASSATTGALGWVSYDCASGKLQLDINSNFTQSGIAINASLMKFGSITATTFPDNACPIAVIAAGTTPNQWNVSAITTVGGAMEPVCHAIYDSASTNMFKAVDTTGKRIWSASGGGGGGGGGGTSGTSYAFPSAVFSWGVSGTTHGKGCAIGVHAYDLVGNEVHGIVNINPSTCDVLVTWLGVQAGRLVIE